MGDLRMSSMELDEAAAAEEEDIDEEEDTDADDSDDEPAELEKRVLPSRSTRGTRMSKLVGEELDKDAEFWDGEHGVWESGEEDSFSDQGSSDSADSDIDDSEEEDLDDGAKEEAALRKSEKRSRVAQNQQKMTYKDPGLKKKSTATTTAPVPKRKAPAEPAAAVIPGEGRSFRKSTVALSGAAETERAQKRQKQQENAKKREEQNKHKEPEKKLTQAQLLAEAARTEILNQRSLQALLHIEEEKKRVRQKKVKDAGPLIRFHSKNGRNLITFTDPEGVPPVIQGRVDRYPIAKRCAVTGLPAKYIDPKSGHPYANAEAFRKLRGIVPKGIVEAEE